MPSSTRKRRRASNQDCDDSRGKGSKGLSKATGSPKNPFLCLCQGEKSTLSLDNAVDDSRKNDDSFEMVVEFLDLTRRKVSPAFERPSINTKTEKTLPGLAQKLLEKLIQERSTPVRSAHSLISVGDISSLLLPWAIKGLLRPTSVLFEHELLWKILKQSTELLLEYHQQGTSSAITQELSSHFSLSNLHKLVPLAWEVALNGESSERLLSVQTLAAECYCAWIQHMYKPSFDTACNSLVPLVGKGAQVRLMGGVSSDRSGERYDEMLSATLVLIQTSLKKANPKKAFATLIQPHIISALSDIYGATSQDLVARQCVVQHLIDEGIFHVGHHIDGFRSIQMEIPNLRDLVETSHVSVVDEESESLSPQKKVFQCYQQGLLAMVRDAFVDSSASRCKIGSMARMMPVLLEGFIRASNRIHTQKGGVDESTGKKKANAKKIGQLQMAFFANLTEPVLRFTCSNRVGIDSIFVTVLCDSLYQCTNLLLKYDIYLPSNDDESSRSFGFLKVLSETLIGFASTPSSVELAIKSLPVLVTVLQLNHLVFHENLSRTIASCLTLQGRLDDKPPPEVILFFSQMIVTYKQLRQLDYLCNAIKSAATDLSTRNRTSALQSFCVLTENDKIVHEFSDAVQDSPIQQVKEIVSGYSLWIDSNAASRGTGSNRVNDAMPVVVNVFCLLLRSARVDAASAHELSPLCRDIGSIAVTALVPASASLKSSDYQTRLGLLLCAWTLDLGNRCNFWLRNSRQADKDDDFDLPISVSSILSEGVEQILSNTKVELHGSLEEIQLLACNRLQQLHSRIHEKQRVSFATDAEEFSIETDVQETTDVANFALKALQLERVDGDNFNRRWDSVASAIGSWAPYVDNDTMMWFLDCFCSRVSADGSGGDSAMWLLRDASFLETPKVLENFGPSVLSHVASSLQEVFRTSNASERFWHDLSYSPASPLWMPLQTSQMNQISRTDEEMKIVLVEGDWMSRLPKLLRCLKILNAIKAATWDSCSLFPGWLETCVRIDYICWALAKQSGASQHILIDLMSETRKTMSRLLSDNQQNPVDKDLSSVILSTLFRLPLGLLRQSAADHSSFKGLVDSTKSAISHLIRVAREQNVIQVVVDEYYAGEAAVLRDPELLLLMSFGCSLVAELAGTKQDHRAVNQICDTVWLRATRIVVDSGGIDPKERHVAFLFVSQILRLEFEQSRYLKSAERVVVDAVQSIDGEDSSQLQYLSYLIGCLAAAKPSRESRLTLFDSLIGFNGQMPDIIQDALCQLAVSMDPDELSERLAMLADLEASQPRSGSYLRLFRLVMVNARSDVHIESVSKSSRQVFSLALAAMISQERNRTVGDGVALIQEIASNRNILSIRERELCLILSHTVGALQPASDEPSINPNKTSNTIFDSCFSMVAFLLQRFSKQLHNCIPSVISCLSVILGHCLYGELSELDIIDRGRKFSRLVELLLPHGDVYKKHVLCLVVEFVQALKREMNPIRRSCLSPAVYCLLDILQQHETAQLNSMLDDMGRALLGTVHESYKKQHVYKGQ
jgi:Urb2/Npa2 family